MTRAVPYAIKSQAATYAASPLWADGTYDWDDALDISKEALGTLLANDYKLFDVVPQEDIAQNPYALYFITSSDDQRSVDKETIYQCGAQMEVWRSGPSDHLGDAQIGPVPHAGTGRQLRDAGHGRTARAGLLRRTAPDADRQPGVGLRSCESL